MSWSNAIIILLSINNDYTLFWNWHTRLIITHYYTKLSIKSTYMFNNSCSINVDIINKIKVRIGYWKCIEGSGWWAWLIPTTPKLEAYVFPKTRVTDERHRSGVPNIFWTKSYFYSCQSAEIYQWIVNGGVLANCQLGNGGSRSVQLQWCHLKT